MGNQQFFSSARPDLILLDLTAKNVQGYDFCKRMKSSRETDSIPIMLMGDDARKEDVIRGLHFGAVDFITRPFNLNEIIARIKNHLELKFARETITNLNTDLIERNDEYEDEIRQATHFVTSILPQPMQNPFTINWKYLPSKRLGGDTFNYYFYDDDHLIIYMLDVSGHGLVAALLSVSITNILRAQALPKQDFLNPASILKALNNKFQIEDQGGRYLTLWYGVYKVSTRELTFSSGGHPFALQVTARGDSTHIQQLQGSGLPIGLFPTSEYKNEHLLFPQNSYLYVFSDGTFEVSDPEHSIFGYEKFSGLIKDMHQKGNANLNEVMTELESFHGHDRYDDDLSLIQIQFNGG